MDTTPRASQNKSSKKSTKSRSKSTKTDSSTSSVAGSIKNSTSANINMVTTPTTPTGSSYNFFDASFAGAGGTNSTEAQPASSSKSHQKSYAGLEPRTVKIMWEQHDQTDLELSQDVCARVAEDASYKLWELINQVKTYARHSGGIVTYDLVNEVLKDADVPPVLGAMDSDWERVDYDGSYFFHSDKVLELRDEYQKEVNYSLPDGPDFVCTCPLDEKHLEAIKQYFPHLLFAALYSDMKTARLALSEAVSTPLMGSCYRIIVSKIVNVLAFKQQDAMSQRCWRLLRACNANPYAYNIYCREEYFHLAEILICQLLAPYETIKPHEEQKPQVADSTVKIEVDTILNSNHDHNTPLQNNSDTKHEQFVPSTSDGVGNPTEDVVMDDQDTQSNATAATGNRATKIQLVEDNDEVEMVPSPQPMSPYFACPVGNALVPELCETIGLLAAQNGYLHGECLYLINRRLERFFEGREVCSERDYSYLSRAVRGLLALGEYAFREFIPYIYKLPIDDIPESLWNDLAFAAIFLNGRDDIFLYEWLEYGCGADKLQPFMVNTALAHEKLLIRSSMRTKSNVYKICPILGMRRLEWSTLAAAMCHGDDPSKALKPKPSMEDAFPDIVKPNLQLNRSGIIRFKFAGCRPVSRKPKNSVNSVQDKVSPSLNGAADLAHSDILIARRKLFKPLTNLRSAVPLCSYYYTKIN